MSKCVCILTAGKGGRLKEKTEYFNKALLRVGNKAVISYTIDEFSDKDTEFVIVLGYKGDIVKQYLEIAHPNKKFTFIWTDKYSEPGAGPGYAMLQAKESLQRPFFYVACDSIINWQDPEWHYNIKSWDSSWAAIAEIPENEKENYCTIEAEDFIIAWYNKDKNGTTSAFTGIAYIHEYKEFWHKLEQEHATENGEIPNAPAILDLDLIEAIDVKWWDTGSEKGLSDARGFFEGINNLDKVDEELYVVRNSVIKYFHNENIVKHRAERTKYLSGLVPELTGLTKNYYRYNFVPGQDLFKIKEPHKILKKILDETQKQLWSQKQELSDIELKIFKDVCKKFYYNKTISRLKKLNDKISVQDSKPSMEKLFKKINWDYLSDEAPSRWHGDYNFSNIVWNEEKEEFKLLDWRQDFGGIIEYGSVYYDLAKMYHGFLFPHPSVKEKKYYIKKQNNGKIKTFIEIPCEIEICKDIFEEFVEENGYDLWKVKILTAIVLLNMSPLHESPIDEYLYYFAKDYLRRVLSE